MGGNEGPETKNHDATPEAAGTPAAAPEATPEVPAAEAAAEPPAAEAPAPEVAAAEVAAEPPAPKAPAAEAPPEPDWKEQHDKTRNQLLRVAADFDNFKKRTRRDLQDAAHRARDEILQDILPVIDNLERAIDHASSAKDGVDADNLLAGVQMVLRSFQGAMERFEVRGFAAVGQPFDPNFHEAISQQVTAEHPPGTVVEEYRRGYLMGERLIRPAMVVVAKAPAPDAEGSASEGDAAAEAPEAEAGPEAAPDAGDGAASASAPGGDTDETSASAPEERS